MGKIILVTGGAKSGKSLFTERLVKESNQSAIAYIATQSNQVFDEETKLKIKKHQLQRPTTWVTKETHRDLPNKLQQWQSKFNYDGYLIDCVTMLINNLFFDQLPIYAQQQGVNLTDYDTYIEFLDHEAIAYFEVFFANYFTQLIEIMQSVSADFWLVTNEVGSSIVPESKLGRLFRDFIGQVNQQLAQAADEVYLVTAGIDQRLKP